jgi:tripartite-type tricarboxylate transporter receptor subunit TctC
MLHVPYRGGAPSIIGLMGNEVQAVFDVISTSKGPSETGKLRALAALSLARIPSMPDLPTVAESGYPDYEVTNWHGLVGPKGMPREIVARLNREVNEAIHGAEMKKQLSTDGLEPAGGSPERFAGILKSEAARWGKVVQQAGIKID